ncbi:MAG: TatD family hydrolase [Fermentimonas sp.]|jgi:TatD DNase family protein
MEFYDVHTHQILLEENDDPYHSCIFDVYPLEFEVAKDSHRRHAFSCGIHPWYSEGSETQMAYLTEIASNPRIVAIGETGLDRLKGPSFSVQIPLFKQHVILAEKLGKPLIIHCVKAWEELIHVCRELKPSQPSIIHGYRGRPELTNRLVNEGFLFSIGDHLNVDSLPLIPMDRLFCETDEGDMSIRDVYLQVSQVLNMELEEFAEAVAANVRRVFPDLQPPKPYFLDDEELEE